MAEYKGDEMLNKKNETESKVWPPTPTSLPPVIPLLNNGWKIGTVSLIIALPVLLCSSLDSLQSRGHIERIFGRSVRMNEIDGSGLWLIFYFIGAILGLSSWQSWQGKLGIFFSLVTFVSGVLLPTFH